MRGQVHLAVVLSIFVMVLITACSSTRPVKGSSIQFTESRPRVLTAEPNHDPVYDPAGVDWNGILRHAHECDCIVLEESDAKDAVTFIAWPVGSTGFTEAGTMGVILTDARRVKVGEHVAGRGWREPFSGRPPAAIPNAQDECLLVSSIN